MKRNQNFSLLSEDDDDDNLEKEPPIPSKLFVEEPTDEDFENLEMRDSLGLDSDNPLPSNGS